MKGIMKGKFSSMWRVAIALVMVLSLGLVMAAPVVAAVATLNIESPTELTPAYVSPGGSVGVTFNGTAGNDEVVDVRILIDNGIIGDSNIFTVTANSTGGYTGSKTVAISASAVEGEEYDLTVKAKVGAQGWITKAESSAVIVDSIAPTVGLDPITDYANPSVITGTASDAASGVDKVELTIMDEDSQYWTGTTWGAETWLDATSTDDWATWSYDTTDGTPVTFEDGKSYTVTAKATDVATNETAVVNRPQDTFIADTVDPLVTVTTTVDDPTSVAPSVIEGTASDARSGVQKVEVQVSFDSGTYYWDGSHWVTTAESWVEATGTTSWSFAVPTLTNARGYMVNAKATDNAGNSDNSSITFTYDAAAPTVAIEEPVEEYYADFDTISGTSSGAIEAEVLLKDDTASLYWDGDSWETGATWLDAAGPGSWTYNVAALSDSDEENGEFSDGSSYTVTAKASDNATPANYATDQATFTYDIGAPAVAIDDITDYVVEVSEITGTASDTGSGVASANLTIMREDSQYWTGTTWGAETWLDATSTDDWATWSYDTTAGTPVTFEDGKSYTVTAMATDGVGNETADADKPEDSFTLDCLPTATINAIDSYVKALDSITGSSSDNVPGSVTLVQLQIKNTTDSTYWTGAAWGAETWLDATSTETWSYDTSAVTFANGESYDVYARSNDNAGQLSATADDSFAYDTASPTVNIAGLPSEIRPDAIIGTASDAGSGVASANLTIVRDEDGYYWDGTDNWTVSETWLEVTTGKETWSYTANTTGFQDGKSYTVTAMAADGVGNETAEVDRPTETFTYGGNLIQAATIDLVAGWNLISLPLIPDDSTITTVLAGVTVDSVWNYTAPYSPDSWSSYFPGAPEDLVTMVDGKGYWVKMSAPAVLTFQGVEMTSGAVAPRTYDVVVGWNFIGFKSITAKEVSNYLAAIKNSYTLIYAFDAANQAYVTVQSGNLEPGKGYWIAVTAVGTIYP